MWLKRKKRQGQEEQSCAIGGRLHDIQKMAEELEEAHRWGVTRDDYNNAVIYALVEMHPEIKEHPRVREVVDKVQSFLVFKGKLKDDEA